MPSTEINTSKCNAGSLTKGDLLLDHGRTIEITDHPRLVTPQHVELAWRVQGDKRPGAERRDNWRRNWPMNRITGARAGGQV